MDEEAEIAESAGGCTLTTVQKEHLDALLELEKLVRSPYTCTGEYYAALRRLDLWQPFVPNPAAM